MLWLYGGSSCLLYIEGNRITLHNRRSEVFPGTAPGAGCCGLEAHHACSTLKATALRYIIVLFVAEQLFSRTLNRRCPGASVSN